MRDRVSLVKVILTTIAADLELRSETISRSVRLCLFDTYEQTIRTVNNRRL